MSRTPHRFVAARPLLALLLLAAQLGGFTHLALERHAVCAEHGEMIEADAAQSPEDAMHAAENARDPFEAQLHEASTTGLNATDEHCAVSALRRVQVTITAAQLVALALAVPAAPSLVCSDAAPSSEALFRTAPKQSPPV